MATFQDIPLPGDLLSVSQADLKGNFDYLQGALNKDHQVLFGDQDTTQFEGRHRQVSLLNRGGAVAHPGDGTDSFWYSNAGNTFWRNSTVGPVQMTNASVPLSAAAGYTFLPGGMLLQWGNFLDTAATPTVFPIVYTTVYQVIGSTSDFKRPLAVTAVANNGFAWLIENPNGLTVVRWFAIGSKP